MNSHDADNARDPAREALVQSLEPVHQVLLTDAAAEAARIVAEARRDADAQIAAARRDADAQVEAALTRAALAGQAHADQLLARARSDANAVVLRAQDDIRRSLVDQVRQAALGLRDDPRYPAVLDELEAMARQQLGPDAVIVRDPPEFGGVVATAGSRRVDYTLRAVADRALDAIADDIGALWS